MELIGFAFYVLFSVMVGAVLAVLAKLVWPLRSFLLAFLCTPPVAVVSLS
jgi:hypothetical protein